MRWGMLYLSTGRHPSARLRAVALGLSVVTIGSGFIGVIPVEPASAATVERTFPHAQGRLAAPSAFVPPTADAGDDQSVPEGNVVTLDATRSTSSNLVTRTYTTSADFAEGTSINLTDTPARPASPRRHDGGVRVHLDRRLPARHRRQDRHRDRRGARRVLVGAAEPASRTRRGPRSTTTATSGSATAPRPAPSAASPRAPSRRSASSRTASASTATATGRSTRRPASTTSRPGRTRRSVDTDGGVETAVDECILTLRPDERHRDPPGVRRRREPRLGRRRRTGRQRPASSTASAPDGTIVRSINMRVARPDRRDRRASAAATAASSTRTGSSGRPPDANNLVRLDPSKPNGHADLIRDIDLGRTSRTGSASTRAGSSGSRTGPPTPSRRSALPGEILGTFPTERRRATTAASRRPPTATSGSRTPAAASVSRLRNNGTLVTVIGVGSGADRRRRRRGRQGLGHEPRRRARRRGSTRRPTPWT